MNQITHRPYRLLPQCSDLNLGIIKDVCSTWDDGLLVLGQSSTNGDRMITCMQDVSLYQWDPSLTQVSELLYQGPCLRREQEMIPWNGAFRLQPVDKENRTYVVMCHQPKRREYYSLTLAAFTLTGEVKWHIQLHMQGFFPTAVTLPDGFVVVSNVYRDALMLIDGATGALSKAVHLGFDASWLSVDQDGGLWTYHYSPKRIEFHKSDPDGVVIARVISAHELPVGHTMLHYCTFTQFHLTIRDGKTDRLCFVSKENGTVHGELDFPDQFCRFRLNHRGSRIFAFPADWSVRYYSTPRLIYMYS